MKILTTLAVMLLMCSISSAAVYYVDNLGSDTNTGLSESSPWKSISKVNSTTFQSGDKIYFKRGGKWYETLTVKQNNLTFGSYGTGSLPVIDGQSSRTYNIYMNGRTGVIIQEFNLINAAGSGSVRIESSSNCLVQNCEIYVIAHGGVFIQNSRNCTVSGNKMTTPDYIDAQTDGIYSQRNNGNIYENNNIVISNSADTQHNDGIQCYLDTSITARGNYCEQRNLKSGNAQGIYATNTFGQYYFYNNIINTPNAMSNSMALKNLDATLYKGTVEVYHNTVITKGGNALCIQNAPGFIAKNNIFVSKGTTYAVTIIGSYNGGNLDYNIYYNYGTSGAVVRLENDGGNYTLAMLRAKGLELNGLFGDPLVDVQYMPASNSPVIDKGFMTSLCLIDKNGTVRPQGTACDIGALERISVVVTPTVPAAPSNLNASSNSTNTINLNWTDASNNETGFQLERLDGNWTLIATLGANITSYSNAGLNSGTQYSYRVRAYNGAGSSAYSNTASATTETVIEPPVISDITIPAKTGTLSGGSYLTVKEGSSSDQVVQFSLKSEVQFSVNITAEADWYIDGMFFQGKRSSAFTVQLNGNSRQTFSYNKVIDQWSQGPKVFLGHLTPGTYSISVSIIKPGSGSFLDFICLSTSPTFNEPAQFTMEEKAALNNYPNPFNPSTKISFQIPVTSNVEITIYNSVGEKVADLVNEVKQAGTFQVYWNASHLASGIYFCRMTAGEFINTRKMILMK